MQLSGERSLAATREAVWEALNDTEVLQQCIMGCEQIERLSDTDLQAKVTAKFGPVKASFDATIQLQDLQPPERYRLVGEGKGGVAGFAKGGAEIVLEDQGETTQLQYVADMQVGGKIAQVGSRLVSGTTNKIINEFFNRFEKILSGDDEPEA